MIPADSKMLSTRNIFSHYCFNVGKGALYLAALRANKARQLGGKVKNILSPLNAYAQQFAGELLAKLVNCLSIVAVDRDVFYGCKVDSVICVFEHVCDSENVLVKFRSPCEFCPKFIRYRVYVFVEVSPHFDVATHVFLIFMGGSYFDLTEKIEVKINPYSRKSGSIESEFGVEILKFGDISPALSKSAVKIYCTLPPRFVDLPQDAAILANQQRSSPSGSGQGQNPGDQCLVALDPELPAPLGMASSHGRCDQCGSASDWFQRLVSNEGGKADHYRDPKHDMRRRVLRVRRVWQISRFHPSSVPQATFSGVRMEGGRGRVERRAA